jgi:hypothetical protein
MAGRTIPGYRRRMWDMARIRLRDIGTLPWDSGSSRTVADVFTSEKARAMILRWHIRAPADMARHGRAGAKLKDSLARARNAAPNLNWNADPESWGDQHEKTLVAAIKQEAGSSRRGGLKDTIARVDSWPSWATGSNPRAFALDKGVGSLSEKRGSFGFDGGGLPPAP